MDIDEEFAMVPFEDIYHKDCDGLVTCRDFNTAMYQCGRCKKDFFAGSHVAIVEFSKVTYCIDKLSVNTNDLEAVDSVKWVDDGNKCYLKSIPLEGESLIKYHYPNYEIEELME